MSEGCLDGPSDSTKRNQPLPFARLDDEPTSASGVKKIHSHGVYPKPDENKEIENSIECPPKKAKSIELVILTKPLSIRKQNQLAKMLKEDKVQVFFLKKNEQSKYPRINAKAKIKRFKKRFRGKVEYRIISRNSPPTPYCQTILEDYFIPLEYREFIHAIEIPMHKISDSKDKPFGKKSEF
ncbi:MAG: hypothetical protein GY847_39065 [Proteobacteria bacterium]|nr:hypothetical protein [Pseudomonadota bacterium]